MNKIILIGNLTRDVESGATQSGISYARFTLAVNRPHSKEKEVDFINIVAWRSTAELCTKYLGKGRKVSVVGSLTIRNYESNGEKKQAVEVVAEEIEFLSPSEQRPQQAPPKTDLGTMQVVDEELPF